MDDDLIRAWPLFGLRLGTPRLELTVARDDDLADLVALALAGIHPPDQMPFTEPWTLRSPDELTFRTLRHFWRLRAEFAPDDWTLPFVVRRNGVVVGVQDVKAQGFAVRRTVGTGSWLGQAHQGQGLGIEMRAAVLLFAFDHLGAQRAQSSAFVDNPASRAVSARLGYVANGERIFDRQGRPARNVDLLLTPDRFERPEWTLDVTGFDACRDRLGAQPPSVTD